MGWLKKYRVVKIVPGKIITPWGETLDLSNPDIPTHKIDKLVESGCPFIAAYQSKPVDNDNVDLPDPETSTYIKEKPKRNRK